MGGVVGSAVGGATPTANGVSAPTAGADPATGGATATVAALCRRATPSKPSDAMLFIRVYVPATIAVDGQVSAMGDDCQVQPGVEHVVTVQRPGHSVRRLHVLVLALGEKLQPEFSVR